MTSLSAPTLRRAAGPRSRPLRVALIYVGLPESAEQPVMSPPVGVQVLGALLREHGRVAEIFDSRLQDRSALLGRLDDFDPDVVGFSFLSPSASIAIALAGQVRTGTRFLVAGGPHASIHAPALQQSALFDCIVRREGESALLELCDLLDRGERPPPIIDGAAFAALDTLPDYVDSDCYRGQYRSDQAFRSVYLQLGRGCPMKCTFCELPNREVYLPPRGRFRSIERVMAEVRTYVERWDINFITLVDSIATLNLPLISEFVRRMDAEHPSIGFMFNGHVNRFSRALAEVIGEAQRGRTGGERISVWFGFESGSQRLLDFMKKQTTVADALAVVALCNEHDIQLGANLLLGVPTETDDDYCRHEDFMSEIAPTFPNPNILNPLPGTQMYTYCQTNELLRDPSDYSIWSDANIASRGHGPVLGIDYDRVLETYRRYQVPAESIGDTVVVPRYAAWAHDD